MTYKELFKDFYDPRTQSYQNIRLYNFLQDVALTSSSVRFIVNTLDYAKGWPKSIHPDQLILHLKNMGFDEWPDLEKFILAADSSGFNGQAVTEMFDPAWPDTGETETIGLIQLHNAIRATGFPVHLFDIDISNDYEYEIYSQEDLFKIIKACPSERYRYNVNTLDCDDYSRIFLAWLSQKGKGNAAIGELLCTLVYKTGKTEYHSMCMALTKERNIWIFEPQNDSYIWKFGDPVKWPNTVEVRPVKIRNL